VTELLALADLAQTRPISSAAVLDKLPASRRGRMSGSSWNFERRSGGLTVRR
jgi:hypothetical protein